MNIGMKIRELRLEKGMTQEELAHKVGYKSRVSINKIELQRDVPIKKVALIAEALGVEPSYIMGWEDSKKELYSTKNAQLLAKYAKNSRKMQYLEKFDSLSNRNKELVCSIIDTLSSQSQTIPELMPAQNQERN